MRKLKLTKLKKIENNYATDKDISDAKNMIKKERRHWSHWRKNKDTEVSSSAINVTNKEIL